MRTVRFWTGLGCGVALLALGTGCAAVKKTCATTLHITGQATKTSFDIAKAGVGATVDVAGKAGQVGMDLADRGSKSPAVMQMAAPHVAGPVAATTTLTVK